MAILVSSACQVGGCIHLHKNPAVLGRHCIIRGHCQIVVYICYVTKAPGYIIHRYLVRVCVYARHVSVHPGTARQVTCELECVHTFKHVLEY